jgi:hypothetical protein
MSDESVPLSERPLHHPRARANLRRRSGVKRRADTLLR